MVRMPVESSFKTSPPVRAGELVRLPGSEAAGGTRADRPEARTASAASLLGHLPLFEGVRADELERAVVGATVLRPRAGERLFAAGDRADALYVVVSGRVRLHLGLHAHDRVIAVMGRGDCIGLAVLLDDSHYPVSAQVGEDSVVVRIDAATVLETLMAHPLVSVRLIRDMGAKLASFVRDIGGYTQQTARGRVAGMLVDLHRRDDSHSGTITFGEPKRLIASRLAMTPETLSRELHALAELGLIESERTAFRVLDLPALERAAENDGPRRKVDAG